MEYNISGPGGNVYAVIGNAISWARETWPDDKSKVEELQSLMTGNGPVSPDAGYQGVLDHIEKMFNGSVKFVKDEDEDEEDDWDDWDDEEDDWDEDE